MVSRPIREFHGVFFPVIWMLNRVANLVVRTLGVRGGGRHEVAHSEEELRMILAISHRDGIIPAPTVKLLERALDFADRTVRQVMVPRADLVFLDVNKPFAENLDAARRGGHTRYPLCDGDLDRVIGVVNIKDLFLTPPGEGETVDLRAFAYDPILIPESLALEKALALFQKQRLHLGIVIDEYGGTSGIVTLEDVLEELIGEIQDEFDEEPPKLVALPDGRTSVAATFPLSEIEEKLGIEEQAEEGVDTLGGLVLARLGRLARVGDRVEIGGRMIEVTRVRGRRILRLVTYPPARSGGA
jgi:CBS domain containing-hemolysin-like protein